MNRIAGPMAVMVGFVLVVPAIASVAIAHLPVWLVRDLIFSALAGSVLSFWGVLEVRQRAAGAEKLEEVHARN